MKREPHLIDLMCDCHEGRLPRKSRPSAASRRSCGMGHADGDGAGGQTLYANGFGPVSMLNGCGARNCSVPGAVERLVKKIGVAATRDVQTQAGAGLFVVFGRDGQYSMHWTADETAVLEALAAGLAEVAARGNGGLKFTSARREI